MVLVDREIGGGKRENRNKRLEIFSLSEEE